MPARAFLAVDSSQLVLREGLSKERSVTNPRLKPIRNIALGRPKVAKSVTNPRLKPIRN